CCSGRPGGTWACACWCSRCSRPWPPGRRWRSGRCWTTRERPPGSVSAWRWCSPHSVGAWCRRRSSRRRCSSSPRSPRTAGATVPSRRSSGTAERWQTSPDRSGCWWVSLWSFLFWAACCCGAAWRGRCEARSLGELGSGCCSLFVLDRRDLVEPADELWIGLAAEGGAEERVDDALGHVRANHERPERDDLRTVALPCVPGGERLGAHGAPDTAHLVRRDGDADPRAADQHAALHVLLPDRVGDLTGVGGGVLGTLAAGAGVTVVDHVMPLLPQVGDHHALEVAAGLVAANTDTHTAMIRNLRTANAHASCHVVHSPLGGRDAVC